ncbi:MAG: hypothetical protein WBA93_02140 [Microcoleaceae cyanobacterium]
MDRITYKKIRIKIDSTANLIGLALLFETKMVDAAELEYGSFQIRE